MDPNTIIIPEDRQRKSTSKKLDELKQSIKSLGRLINPITLRRDGDSTILVAGGRRLQCFIDLGLQLSDSDYQFWEDLDPIQAKIIELEENVKREDLTWEESTNAYGQYHALRKSLDSGWTIERTATACSVSNRRMHEILIVYNKIDLPALKDAQSFEQAHGILQRIAERQTASIVNEITEAGSAIFATANLPPNQSSASDSTSPISGDDNVPGVETSVGERSVDSIPPPSSAGVGAILQRTADSTVPPQPVMVESFLQWAPNYSGPKFNLIHVDLPYGVEFENYGTGVQSYGEFYYSREDNYQELLECFCTNLPRFISYSSHVMFWFAMNFYSETKRRLESTGLWVHERPLIWYKSDGSGIVPGGGTAQHFRWVYETAFLCSLGKRPVVKSVANCYGAPPQANPIHPSHKSEPVLRHFFRGLIDDTTDVFDPSCGSGSSLLAAEDCGARSVLGLEVNPDYARAANSHVLNARKLRAL